MEIVFTEKADDKNLFEKELKHGLPFFILRIKLLLQTNKQRKMKKLLFVFVLGAFAACGGGDSTTTSDSTTVSTDASSSTGAMGTDTTGMGAMGTDTSTISH